MRLLAILVLTFSIIAAQAQWTVANLHQNGVFLSSYAFGVDGAHQVGIAQFGANEHASLWAGTAGSWVDLNPAGATDSYANAVSGNQQVGYAAFGGTNHAGLWTGTAGSWVDLNPSGSSASEAYAISSNQQIGWATVGSAAHAGYWAGTAASFVDLNPAGATQSHGYGAGGGQQVGSAVLAGFQRASLWTGSAGSWVNLHPSGASQSRAFAADGGQQVGWALIGTVFHASLWTGTAASWVDLTPSGAAYAYAYGVSGGQQAGYASIGGSQHAGVWSGTAASWVDLNSYIPAGLTNSNAYAIWHQGGTTYVAGVGFDDTFSRQEALLWISTGAQTITANSTSLAPGIVISGTPADMNTSNDVYYVLRPGVVLSSSQSPIVLTNSYTLPANNATALSSVIESHAQQANIRQTIEAFNFSTTTYDQQNQQVLPTTDTGVTSNLTSPSNYIGSGNEVRLKISYKAVGPILAYPWRIYIDEATLRFTP